MTRPRSQSLPRTDSPHPYPPYKYQHLSSPRHIRIIQLLGYDPVLSRVLITLSEHDLSTLPKRFTALSYTWDSAIEPFEVERHSSIIGPDKARLSKNPRDIELVVVPPEAFETFKRNDDASIDPRGSMVDLYSTPVSTITVTGNLSNFFRTYMTDTWPRRHAQSQACGGPKVSLAEITNLWIDAVCINQTNDKEISAQIPLMGEIYSSAGRVLAWLGSDEARLDVFKWWHDTVYPRMQFLLERAGEGAIMFLRSSSFHDAKMWKDVFVLTPPVELGVTTWLDAWTQYWAFYRTRRYFHRVWIVQEVVLGDRLHIYCGRGELSWEDMDGFVNLLGKIQWVDAIGTQCRRNLPIEYTASLRGFGIGDIFEMQRHHNNKLWNKGGWARHWFGAIAAVRRRGCFKPQDNVYATLGILQQILPTDVPFPIPIDTSHTPEQVFTFAAAAILKNWPELSIFGFIEHTTSRTFHSLPSWVPDLTDGEFPWPLGPFDSPFKAGIVMSTKQREYSKEDWAEARSTAPIPSFRHIDPIKGTFCLHGKKLDTIKKKYPCANIYDIELAEVAIEVLGDLPVNYPHVLFPDEETGEMRGQFREAAMIHTMTCHETTNRHRGSAEETQRLLDSFRDWLLANLSQLWSGADLVEGLDPDYWVEGVDRLRKRRDKVVDTLTNMGLVSGFIPQKEEIQQTADAIRAAKRGEGDWPDVFKLPLEFRDQVRRVMGDRCLFTTENGWLGICVDTAQEGDEVWVLEGGPVPYVLRKGDEVEVEIETGIGETRTLKTEGRRFSGETYVHGIMHGEFLEEEEEGNIRWEEVVLV
ncbi:heterokaryon incompatibility protein-domain-containing protein [Apiosordaria backusii]|uniref:Heterokaryon incompatibility protein-domain-containing protein n=1 Tax=Apiosordaria backusii TaxID=314023 RepID=A0AA40BM86_9PEZI|nr:heterokaryon incompatibility protein-domain-containing protein [Apiosordaria backusii]